MTGLYFAKRETIPRMRPPNRSARKTNQMTDWWGIGVELFGLVMGFAGVIWTLMHNASLARKAQESQWEHEEETRKKELERECDSMRKVLGAELATLETITAGPIKKMEANPTGILTACIEPLPDESYQSLLSSIGLLSTLEMEKIPLAYQNRRFATYDLKKIGRRHPESSSHVIVGPEHFDDLIKRKNEVLDGIKSTIAALEDKGRCRKCGKEASRIGCSRQEHTDGTVTETWQSLCEPCSDELKSLTESQATT